MIGLEENSGRPRLTLDEVMTELERVTNEAIKPFVGQPLTENLEEEVRIAVMATLGPRIEELIGPHICLIPLSQFVDEFISDWKRAGHP